MNLLSRSKSITIFLIMICFVAFFAGSCDVPSAPVNALKEDMELTMEVGKKLAAKQPTPTDVEESNERYNLIKRTYWINGMPEKAMAVPRPKNVPLGYVVLLLDGVGPVGNFVVDGKVTSLNTYLTPESDYYELVLDGAGSRREGYNRWAADVDGCFGENTDNGVFFFTVDGKYIEWNGTYIYSDIPFEIESPVLKMEVTTQ